MKKKRKIRKLIQKWVNKQGHDACWYYPDIFEEIMSVLKMKKIKKKLPTIEKFDKGCKQYQKEIFKMKIPKLGFCLSDQRYFRFKPKEDITAYELAVIFTFIINMQSADKYILTELFNQFPETITRHFVTKDF